MSYEDRVSIPTPEGVIVDLTLAGIGSRFIAAVLDLGLRGLALFALALLASAANDGGLVVAVVVVGTFLIFFGYDIAFETLASGRTPGKRWTGLRVVRVGGAPMSFVPSAVRNLLRLVDIIPGPYLVGMISILASSRNQRLGDLAGGTLVVRERTSSPPPLTWFAQHPETATWDVSAVTDAELATVRRFLDRRPTLTPEARQRLANEFAGRLRPKVIGPDARVGAEPFLEALVVAKSTRG